MHKGREGGELLHKERIGGGMFKGRVGGLHMGKVRGHFIRKGDGVLHRERGGGCVEEGYINGEMPCGGREGGKWQP